MRYKYKLKRMYDYCRYDIPQGLKNLVIWFPTVWRDRQWDHHYIYIMLRQKLHFAEQSIRYHGYHLNHIRDANRIKVCVNLLDRLINDVYHENAFKRHREKWGDPDMKFVPIEESKFPSLNGGKYSEMIIKYPNVKSEKDKEKERKDFRYAYKLEEQLRKADLDLLFKLMRKHIQTWWN